MSKEKDDELLIMKFLDGESKEPVDLMKNENLIKKMKEENYAIKSAIENVDDMEDISFSILNQIKREEIQDKKNYYVSLVPIFLVFVISLSFNRFYSINLEIGRFFDLISTLNNLSLVLKAAINAHYLTFIISEIFFISVILIYLIKKGCLKNEI